jgi:hypothetical protein
MQLAHKKKMQLSLQNTAKTYIIPIRFNHGQRNDIPLAPVKTDCL